MVSGSHCSKLTFVKRASVKQLLTNHLGLRIILFTNLYIWKKWCEKQMDVVQTLSSISSKRVLSSEKKNMIEHNFKHL